jgi:hypothetical protein
MVSMETGLEVNTDITKYMVMSRVQNAGRSHNIKTNNSPFQNLGVFKYLETNLTNLNTIQKLKNRLMPENA